MLLSDISLLNLQVAVSVLPTIWQNMPSIVHVYSFLVENKDWVRLAPLSQSQLQFTRGEKI